MVRLQKLILALLLSLMTESKRDEVVLPKSGFEKYGGAYFVRVFLCFLPQIY